MTQIQVVGIGLEGEDGLSETVRQILAKATLLVGSDRHLGYFPDHPAPRLLLKDIGQTLEAIAERLNGNDTIIIFVSGDPLFFGLGRLLLEKFSPQQLQFHPHVTSVQLAFNRIKVPWQDAQFISLHGRSATALTQLLQQGISKIAVLTDRINNPAAIARHYLALDSPARYQFWVCENLGDRQEQINYFSAEAVESLASLPEDSFALLNVVILLQQLERSPTLELSTLPLVGLPDRILTSFADRPGLMTKREVRLIVLGELALQPNQVVWDIGAGTGSVAVEVARLCPTSQVYAIEKTAMGITLIEQNSQRLQLANVHPLYGTAPEILAKLPIPDRVFIGGSGGNLLAILEVCAQKMTDNGLIVMALATLEHLNLGLTWLRDRAWRYHLLQLQISRSVPVGELTRLAPLNPVTIVTASKQAGKK